MTFSANSSLKGLDAVEATAGHEVRARTTSTDHASDRVPGPLVVSSKVRDSTVSVQFRVTSAGHCPGQDGAQQDRDEQSPRLESRRSRFLSSRLLSSRASVTTLRARLSPAGSAFRACQRAKRPSQGQWGRQGKQCRWGVRDDLGPELEPRRHGRSVSAASTRKEEHEVLRSRRRLERRDLAPGDGPSSPYGQSMGDSGSSRAAGDLVQVVDRDPGQTRRSAEAASLSSASRRVPSVKRQYQVARFTPEALFGLADGAPDRRICSPFPPPERDTTGTTVKP